MRNQLFINKFDKGSSVFQKGSNENPNIGLGAMVGFDIYTKKGVAMLAKKTTTVFDTSSLGIFPHFFAVSASGSTWWAQFNNGEVYTSTDSGANWNTTNFPTTGGTTKGTGLIFFQNYMIGFGRTNIFYYDLSATAGWVDWTTTKGFSALTAAGTTPIDALHFPFLYPSSRGVYFGNGATGGSVGFFGQNGTTTFNPAGTTGTDFLYNGSSLTLPSLTYSIGPLNFLPPTNLAISANMFQDPNSADLITWDTVTQNKFSPPLRLYSATTAEANSQGIKQLVNRSQVLYAISGGSHTIYETNGSTFNLVDDVSLYSNIRNRNNGGETTLPVFFNSYPQASCVLGNKLLTGVSTPPNPSYITSSNGIFPIGVWSVAFNPDGSKSTQCEFVLNALGNVSAGATGSYSKITALFPVSNNKVLVGYGQELSGAKTMGIALIDTTTYIDSRSQTSLESPLYEIGTALNPQTVSLIEINLAKVLLAGQVMDISYRTSLDANWTVMPTDDEGSTTFDGDGTKNYFSIQKNNIGPTQYVQFRFRAETGSPNTTESIYFRNIIIS